MKKIRVAFFLNLSENWLGGVNYFRNLLSIIDEYKEFKIEPVVFIAKNSNKNLLKGYPNIEVIESDLLKRWNYKWFIRKFLCKTLKRDLFLENELKKCKIDVISHVQDNLEIESIPMIAWIPDFQHKYLPELFSTEDIRKRNQQFEKLAKSCEIVILSSYDAKRDFTEFLPRYEGKGQVLQFVVPVEQIKFSEKTIKNKYKLQDRFFYLPNQFWKHKNHQIVLEAVKLLKDRNVEIQVVCSGNTVDYRNEDYFSSIKRYIDENNLENNFLILGKIPYIDVQALSQECISLINPSLFEGWSTIVEEAKSMGKRIILSDLSVHKEQNPKGAKYFPRNNAAALSEVLMDVWNANYEFDLREGNKKDLNARKKNEVFTFRKIIEFAMKAR